ncbi:DMT family transporter [Iodobacter sp.]|jgi:drug/metabolite transporter (DMT)-like permease|uniref:DMT family transporter n=1 Tax=Iodobacter sp. TaxID=1915058 RepID=UPI0025F3308C|nr:DMT family transporter [Iodobacter sp.]
MPHLLTYIKLTLTVFFWGAVFHIGKYAVQFLSPMVIGSWRFILAGMMLFIFVSLREKWDISALRANYRPLLAMSVIGIMGVNFSLFYGLKLTSAINAGLIMALSPILTAILTAYFQKESLHRQQLLAMLLSFFGVVIVISGGSLQAILDLHFALGDALVFIASFSWALYSAIPKRFVHGVSPLHITTVTIMAGAVLMTAFAASISNDFYTLPDWNVMLAIGMMAFFCTVLAFVWWNEGLRKIGPAQGAIFMNLAPIFATLISIALGQSPSLPQFIGMILIISGVVYNSRKPATASTPKLFARASTA